MFRWIGIFLFGIALALICLEYLKRQRRQQGQTEGFLQLCRHLKGQITCYSLPIAACCNGFHREELEACGFLPRLQAEGDFAKALQESERELCMEEDVKQVLRAFAAGLGKSYKEEQIALCDHAAGELEKAVLRARRECPRREKLAGSLCITGGLALLLFFL